MKQVCRNCHEPFEHEDRLWRCPACMREYHAEWRLRRGQTHARRASPNNRTRVPEYRIWQNMKRRCLAPTHPRYSYYGGRGITVDPAWAVSFGAFYRDMGKRPSLKHSLDRLDNNKGYFKANCRWATHYEQMNNTRPSLSRNERYKWILEWMQKHGDVDTHTRSFQKAYSDNFPKYQWYVYRGVATYVIKAQVDLLGLYKLGRLDRVIAHRNPLRYLYSKRLVKEATGTRS